MSNLEKKLSNIDNSQLIVFGYCHSMSNIRLIIPISLIHLILQYFVGLLINNNKNPSKRKCIKLLTWNNEKITNKALYTITDCIFKNKLIIGISCNDLVSQKQKIIYNSQFYGIICTKKSGISLYCDGDYQRTWKDINVTKKDIITLEQMVDDNNKFANFSIYINDKHLTTI